MSPRNMNPTDPISPALSSAQMSAMDGTRVDQEAPMNLASSNLVDHVSPSARRVMVQAAMLKDFMKFEPNRDGTGALTVTDFHKLLNYKGIDLSETEVTSIVREFDSSFEFIISFDTFESLYDRAKSRAGLRLATEGVRDEQAYIRSVFDEFKDSPDHSCGAGGITRDRLNQVAEFLHMSIGNRDIDLIFKTLDKDGSGVLAYLEFKTFFEDTNSRNDLKSLLADIHGDYQHNKVFQQKLYEVFDSSKEGCMTREDLKAVMEFLDTVVTLDSKSGTADKIIEQTGSVRKQGEPLDNTIQQRVVSLEEFQDFFEQLAGKKNSNEYVTDFENSDSPKTVFGAIVAFIVFGSAVVLSYLGATMNSLALLIVGLMGLPVAIYIGFHTAGCNFWCCESKRETGAPKTFPVYPTMILFGLGGASYAYLTLVPAADLLPSLMAPYLVIGGLYLICRCAAHSTVVRERFCNPGDIKEQKLTRYVDEEGKTKGPLASVRTPKAKDTRRVSFENTEIDVEVGLPGRVSGDGASGVNLQKCGIAADPQFLSRTGAEYMPAYLPRKDNLPPAARSGAMPEPPPHPRRSRPAPPKEAPPDSGFGIGALEGRSAGAA